ncbi:MAG: putative 2OG-Fe(II) oxygenase, partial [Pseudomonadota bacterium]
FEMARAFIACESGDDKEANARLAQLDTVEDPGLDLCKVRFFLRTNEPKRATDVAEKYIGGGHVRSFWPYLSISWRLLESERAHWLDRGDTFIRSFDLSFDKGHLDELAVTLRALHTAKAPYLEQSVRGGTQTDRNLFFNSDPIIQLTRARLTDAVREYINGLPAIDEAHPLLGPPRDRFRLNGSWSVLLRPEGFNISHTHTDGWISSAFYVDIPDDENLGEKPSGWISFGEPPPTLEIDLAPYAQIKPAPSRLVLFPSTMWHRTVPFDAGERLTIAFDIGANRR